MRKIILMLSVLLVVGVLLAGCAKKELTQEEQQALESQLEQLPDKDLDQAIKMVEAQDTGALAGQAFYPYPKIPKVPKDKFLLTAYKIKLVKATQQETVWNFGAKWDPTKQNKLQFTWKHTNKDKQYYVALDMWNTYNSGPLGSIDMTIEKLQESPGGEFGMMPPKHVYQYQNDQGELYWGWDGNLPSLPSLGTFRIHAYLLDNNYNLVKEIADVQLVVNDYNATSTTIG